MQFAKDSFYMALCERLASVNPQRVVPVNGVDRTAVMVTENEANSAAAMLPDVFYLEWRASRIVEKQGGGGRPLIGIDCVISYGSQGTSESGVDRGRTLATLDGELLTICHPLHTRKRDFSQTPSVDLLAEVFWSAPEWGNSPRSMPSQSSADPLLRHQAQVTVFFFPEGDLA